VSKHLPYTRQYYTPEQQLQRATEFYTMLDQRRSIRFFADTPISDALIDQLILSAGTAPSGAHKQPWTFCIVRDSDLKKKIRIAAEEEEKESYTKRMSEEWLSDLAPLGTDWQKPFLEIAPALIIVFKKSYDIDESGAKHLNYYVQESVGIAVGMLLAAINHAGLCSLTHTPSPMNFLSELLQRPSNEKPFLLIPIGYAAANCTVPDLERKALVEISQKY
jgi:iodotyrosine deiodinase